MAGGLSISSDQMMTLMLKAQTNHFAHLDVDLRSEMRALREDMDKHFDQLTSRMDHFMIGSFATTLTVGGIVIAAIKFL